MTDLTLVAKIKGQKAHFFSHKLRNSETERSKWCHWWTFSGIGGGFHSLRAFSSDVCRNKDLWLSDEDE